MQTTHIIPIAQQSNIPQPYLCERCGRLLVGLIDVANDQFIGFYNFRKTPSGKDGDAALAPFQKTVQIEQWRKRQPTKRVATFDPQLPFVDVDDGPAIIEKIVISRPEENVCAECMHGDPAFATAAGVPVNLSPPPHLAVIPAPVRRKDAEQSGGSVAKPTG